MKKFLIITVLGTVISIVVIGLLRKPNKPLFTKVNIEERVINIGNNKVSNPSEALFVLKNVGSNNLVIDNITTDCHCTAIVPYQRITEPGDSLIIKAEYDNSSTGFFNQSIMVHLNTETSPELLIIRGRVVE